jgi:hypothetical protein
MLNSVVYLACDSCNFEHSFETKKTAKEFIKEEKWLTRAEKHFCPNCREKNDGRHKRGNKPQLLEDMIFNGEATEEELSRYD